MNELIPPGAGVAGAIVAAGYAVDRVGQFLRETFPKATGELDLALASELARWRVDREQRFKATVTEVAAERHLTTPREDAPLGVLYPLLEAACLEDDDELRRHWAEMFVNAIDADRRVEVRRAYVSIFQDLTRLDVRILGVLHSASGGERDACMCSERLPDAAEVYRHHTPIDGGNASGPRQYNLPNRDVLKSLWNLVRLGLIKDESLGSGDDSLAFVSITSLGAGLIEACTSPDPTRSVSSPQG